MCVTSEHRYTYYTQDRKKVLTPHNISFFIYKAFLDLCRSFLDVTQTWDCFTSFSITLNLPLLVGCTTTILQLQKPHKITFINDYHSVKNIFLKIKY